MIWIAGTVEDERERPHELTAIAYAAIYAELNETFHVARYSDIPDARWLDVTAWFSARIERAARKRH